MAGLLLGLGKLAGRLDLLETLFGCIAGGHILELEFVAVDFTLEGEGLLDVAEFSQAGEHSSHGLNRPPDLINIIQSLVTHI